MAMADRKALLKRIDEIESELSRGLLLLAIRVRRKALKRTARGTGLRKIAVKQAIRDGDVTITKAFRSHATAVAKSYDPEIDPDTLAMIIELILALLMMFFI